MVFLPGRDKPPDETPHGLDQRFGGLFVKNTPTSGTPVVARGGHHTVLHPALSIGDYRRSGGLGLAVLREPVVRLLFLRGTFDERDAAMTSLPFSAFPSAWPGSAWGRCSPGGFTPFRTVTEKLKMKAATRINNILSQRKRQPG